jgi:hypothetical protein
MLVALVVQLMVVWVHAAVTGLLALVQTSIVQTFWSLQPLLLVQAGIVGHKLV